MITLDDQIVMKVKYSFYPNKGAKYLLYLPTSQICGQSFFQWLDNSADLNNALFDTLLVLNTEAFMNLGGKKFTYARNNILDCFQNEKNYNEGFKRLKIILKKLNLKISLNFSNCFMGNITLLSHDASYFAIKFRTNYRTWLYGFSLENTDEIDIFGEPIGIKEVLKLYEFLELPYNH